MPRVVHFEISADDPDQAARFYTDMFSWKINKWDGPQEYWLITTGEGEPGIDGGLMRRQGPSNGTVNTVDVPDLDVYVKRVESKGGKVVAPRMTVPGVGYLAYCQDPAGNTFGMLQSDPAAA